MTKRKAKFSINQIVCGDSLVEMKKYPVNSFDAIVTDIPYGIGFMGKEWDTFNPKYIAEAMKKDNRLHKGIASQRRSNTAGSYDHSRNVEYQEWCRLWSAEALRVAKPGAFLLCFGGTRTYHRVTCGIEDAGWIIRDCLNWLYGSGFPKSLDISKAIDKAKGATRENTDILSSVPAGVFPHHKVSNEKRKTSFGDVENKPTISLPSTELAKMFDGYGTALKPAWEPIVVAMKPLDGTFVQNAEKWGIAGLNIDGGRIEHNEPIKKMKCQEGGNSYGQAGRYKETTELKLKGRWPANVILDEVSAAMLDEQSGDTRKGAFPKIHGKSTFVGPEQRKQRIEMEDSGGASRFFYCTKASRSEKNSGLDGLGQIADDGRKKKIDNAYLRGKTLRQNIHPTVKPLDLMIYLCKLLKPPKENPILLDPFSGSGTTLIAAYETGWNWVGVEKEPDYVKIAEKRIAEYKNQYGLLEQGKK